MVGFLRDIEHGISSAKKIQKGLNSLGINKNSVKAKYEEYNAKGKPAAAAGGEASAAPAAASASTDNNATAAPPAATDTASAAAPATSEVTPAKLSLQARKSIRDDFEAKRAGLEGRIMTALGTPWTIVYDAPVVFSYAAGKEALLQAPGPVLLDYFEGATSKIESFAKERGAEGIARLNAAAPSHSITIEATTDKNVIDSGCNFLHGALVVLFNESKLGENRSNCFAQLDEHVNAAEAAAHKASPSAGYALSPAANQSLKDQWEPKSATLLSDARKFLQAPELQFVPNSEENYAKLRAWEAKGNLLLTPDWDAKMGATTAEYFDGFVAYLKSNGFAEDDMLQEGFKEAVEKNQVVLRVVESLKDTSKKNDCNVEAGVCYLDTLPEAWGTQASKAVGDLMQRL